MDPRNRLNPMPRMPRFVLVSLFAVLGFGGFSVFAGDAEVFRVATFNLDRLQAAGAPGAVLVGDPDWYARFGFAARPGLTVQGVPAQYVLAVPFGSDTPRGEILFHPAFGLA